MRRVVPRWLGVLLGVALLAGLGVVFGSVYWEGYELRREAARLARERDDLRRHNAQLREEIKLLNTPEYIERLAREHLGLVKRGEIVMMVVPAPTTVSQGPAGERAFAATEAERDRDSWWARLRRWLR